MKNYNYKYYNYNMSKKQVYIIGCGGNSKIVVDICLLNGYEIMGIFDDKFGSDKISVYRNCQIMEKLVTYVIQNMME